MTVQELFKIGMDRDIHDLLPFPEGMVLNVGAGNKLIDGTTVLDYPEWNADEQPIPYGNGMVSGIHAYHFLEHCAKPMDVIMEFQRVLKVGGVVNICVPYYSSQMQAQDLDHKCCFCENTWRILMRNSYYDSSPGKSPIEWRLRVHFNVIIGIVEKNMCLLTQLIKE
jgi:hypothetical protein